MRAGLRPIRFYSRVARAPMGSLVRREAPGKANMARFNPVEFIGEVRQEVSKVTWPKPREVWITTVLVGIMVALASIFFMIADFIIGGTVNWVLSGGPARLFGLR